MRRTAFLIFALGLTGVFSAAGAMDSPDAKTFVAGDRVAMPYSCTIEDGSLFVRPGPERAFNIANAADQRLFTSCDPPFSNNCTSITVYRFDVMCGAARVPWAHVVAAIHRTTAGNAGLAKGGHLVLETKASPSAGHAPSCKDRKASSGLGMSAGGECLPWRAARAKQQLVLPKGYAPLREVGARLVGGASHSEWTAVDVMTSRHRRLTAGAAAPADSPDGSSPTTGSLSGNVTLADLSGNGPVMGNDWTTVVLEPGAPTLAFDRPNRSPFTHPVQVRADSQGPGGFLWVALVACLALIGAYFARLHGLAAALPFLSGIYGEAARHTRRAVTTAHVAARDAATGVKDALGRAMAPAPDDVQEPQDVALAGAFLHVRTLLSRTQAAVSMLASSTVTREVMETELADIRARLANAEAEAARSGIPVMALMAQLRGIVREIDRVHGIASSAARSISEAQKPAT